MTDRHPSTSRRRHRRHASARRLTSALVAFVLLAVGLAACGDDDDDGGSGADAAAEIDETAVLRVGVDLAAQGDLKFDPTTMGAGQYVKTLPVLRTLLTRTADGSLKPDLAESARVVDRSTVEVVLRPDMKFSDGTALDAAAVKAAFERNVASNHTAGLLISDMKYVETITVDSPTKLTIELNAPYAAVVYSLLAGVEFAPYKVPPAGQSIDQTAIGAGPMRITSYSPASKITFEKNPYYWDADNVHLAGMEYLHVEAGAAVANALRAGQVDFVITDPEQAATFSAPIVTDSQPTTSALNMLLCIRPDAPLGDVRVRKAIAYAIDRELFNEAALSGVSEPAWDLWPSASPWHNEDLEGIYDYDPQRARQLLTEAGYPNGFQFNVVVAQASVRQMEVLQAQLGEAGIEMGIVVSPNTGSDFYQRVLHPATFAPSRPGPLDKLSRAYLSASSSNVCDFPVPEVDRLFEELAGTPLDSDEATELWHDIQEVIVEDLALYPLVAFQPSSIAYDSDRIGELVTYYDQLGGRQIDPVGTYIKR